MGNGRGPNRGNKASPMAWTKGPLFTTCCHLNQLVYIRQAGSDYPCSTLFPQWLKEVGGVGDVVIKIPLTPGAESADQALTSA